MRYGNQQWLCSFSQTNCLLLPVRVRWASSPLRGQCSTGASYPQRRQRLHPCRFSGLSYVKPWLSCSRATNSHALSGKPDQLAPEALITHILWFLSLFTTSGMVKWQNTIFYNISNILQTTERNLLLEWYKESVICWTSSQVKMQSNPLSRDCWLLETFQTFSQVPSC